MSIRLLSYCLVIFIVTSLTSLVSGNSNRQAYQPRSFALKEPKDGQPKNYPILTNSGYITYTFSGREFSNDPNLFDTIQRDETFLKIPKSIQLGPPRLELSYLLELNGQLDDDLFVSYYLFKEPDFPGKYSIEIRKDTSTLRFGQQPLEFKDRPFLQTKRSIEGVQFTTAVLKMTVIQSLRSITEI